MKKTAIILLVVIMLTAMLTGCKNTDIPDGMKTASADNVPYMFFVPMSWVSDVEDNISSAYYSVNDQSNVAVTAYAAAMTVEEYWKLCCEDYQKTFTAFVFDEKDVKSAVLGGKNAKQYTYKIRVGEKSYKLMQTITQHDNIMYSLTYTASEENFDKHLDDVNTIISQFRFR